MSGKLRKGERVVMSGIDGEPFIIDSRGHRRPFHGCAYESGYPETKHASRDDDTALVGLMLGAARVGGAEMVENVIAAATPGGIEAQEKRGQMRQEKAKTLPIQLSKEQFEKAGFKFGKVIDKLFQEATFPEGWMKQATDHSMWSDIVDAKGRKRGSIFYKAAFYDQDAFANLSRRFDVRQTYPEDRSTPTVSVYIEDACGLVDMRIDGLPNSSAIKVVDDKSRQKYLAAGDKVDEAKKELWNKLKEQYPECDTVHGHWDV